jgi:WD40 repeat protein
LISPDGKWLAVKPADANIQMWDIAERKRLWKNELSQGISSVAFSPDGKQLVTQHFRDLGGDMWLRFWDTRDGQLLSRVGFPPRTGSCERMVWLPGRDALAMAGVLGLNFWQVKEGRFLLGDNDKRPRGSVRAVSADSEVIAELDRDDDRVRIWKTRDLFAAHEGRGKKALDK